MQPSSHINKGLIIAAVLIIFNAVTQFTKTVFDDWTNYIFVLIILIGVVISVLNFSRENNQTPGFSVLFAHGFKTTAVIACIYFIYAILAANFFFPNFIEEKFAKGLEEAKKQGALNDIDLKNRTQDAEKLAKKVIKYGYIAGSLMATLFFGVIGSIIGSVAAKKSPQAIN